MNEIKVVVVPFEYIVPNICAAGKSYWLWITSRESDISPITKSRFIKEAEGQLFAFSMCYGREAIEKVLRENDISLPAILLFGESMA